MGIFLRLSNHEPSKLAKEYYGEIMSLSRKLEFAQRFRGAGLDGTPVGVTHGFSSEMMHDAAFRFHNKYPDCKAEELISLLSNRPKGLVVMEESLIAIILGRIGDSSAVKILIKYLQREKKSGYFAESLGMLQDKSAVLPLISVLNNKSYAFYVRTSAAEALGRLKDSRAIKPLQRALNDSDKYVRTGASEALNAIQGNLQ